MRDLAMKGGHILAPSTGTDTVGDIGVFQGKVTSLGCDLETEAAAQVVEAHGLFVTPGLVDIYTHLWPGGGYWGQDPETIAWRTGTTTWVDAGSADAFSLAGLRHATTRTELSISACINVSSIGISGETGEHHDLTNLNVDPARTVAAQHGDFVAGVKARIDRRTVGNHGVEPLVRARKLADQLDRPLMVHVGYGPPHITDILPLMQAGDILTHCASGSPSDLRNEDGSVDDCLLDATDRGVRFDIGHESGAFDHEVLEAELAAGLKPTISTDLHAVSAHGSAFDMPTVMEKLMAIGWSLNDVVEAATPRPASFLNLDAGSLIAGSRADIAIFDVIADPHPLVDVHGQTRTAPVRLRNTLTLASGWPLTEKGPGWSAPWAPMSEAHRKSEQAQLAELRASSSPRLHAATDFPEPYPKTQNRTPVER